MRQFFVRVFAFVLGGCNSAKGIGGMYRLISDDPRLQRVTLEIEDTRVSGQSPSDRYFGSIVQSGISSSSRSTTSNQRCKNSSQNHILYRMMPLGVLRKALALMTHSSDQRYGVATLAK